MMYQVSLEGVAYTAISTDTVVPNIFDCITVIQANEKNTAPYDLYG